jgi:hypothetical protein
MTLASLSQPETRSEPGIGSASPYPGLRPFRSDEADIFFGREEQIDNLLERLQRSRFLSVVGPSGCGKSSLVRAGMIAAIEAGFMAAAGSAWRIAEMRPGDRPMARLAQALLTPHALAPERTNGATAAALLEAQLRRGPLGLAEAPTCCCSSTSSRRSSVFAKRVTRMKPMLSSRCSSRPHANGSCARTWFSPCAPIFWVTAPCSTACRRPSTTASI